MFCLPLSSSLLLIPFSLLLSLLLFPLPSPPLSPLSSSLSPPLPSPPLSFRLSFCYRILLHTAHTLVHSPPPCARPSPLHAAFPLAHSLLLSLLLHVVFSFTCGLLLTLYPLHTPLSPCHSSLDSCLSILFPSPPLVPSPPLPSPPLPSPYCLLDSFSLQLCTHSLSPCAWPISYARPTPFIRPTPSSCILFSCSASSALVCYIISFSFHLPSLLLSSCLFSFFYYNLRPSPLLYCI